MTLFLEQWGDQVAEATSGQIGITVYPGATLSAGTDVAEAVLTGTVDIGWCFTTFFPNQFPLTEVTTLPMLGLSHPSEAAEVLWDLYDYSEDLRTELGDYKVLMMLGNPPNMLFTAKKPVHTLEDLAGLRPGTQNLVFSPTFPASYVRTTQYPSGMFSSSFRGMVENLGPYRARKFARARIINRYPLVTPRTFRSGALLPAHPEMPPGRARPVFRSARLTVRLLTGAQRFSVTPCSSRALPARGARRPRRAYSRAGSKKAGRRVLPRQPAYQTLAAIIFVKSRKWCPCQISFGNRS